LEFERDISLEQILARDENGLVAGLLYPGTTGTMYGKPLAAKTFVALDLALAVAQGRSWHGRRVTQAPVLYVSLENNSGFRQRMLAAKTVYGDAGEWFARLVPDVLLNKSKAGDVGVRQIINACRELERLVGQPVGLVVIDTKARATAGDDENSVADAAVYQGRTADIAKATGAAVLSVHHENKQGGYRGSSAQLGGDDPTIRVEEDKGRRWATAEKVKDGDTGRLLDFSLEIITLGSNKHGEPVTSCVIRRTSFQPKPKNESMAARLLRAVFSELEEKGEGETAPMPETEAPGYWIDIEAVRQAFVAAYVSGKAEPDKAKDTATRTWRRATKEDLPDDFTVTEAGVFHSKCPFSAME